MMMTITVKSVDPNYTKTSSSAWFCPFLSFSKSESFSLENLPRKPANRQQPHTTTPSPQHRDYLVLTPLLS